MPWFLGEGRGPQWKQGWRAQTLRSLSLPPAPLVAIFAIVLLFLSLPSSWRKGYKETAERAEVGLRLLLVLVPLMLVFAAKLLVVDGRLVLPPRVLREEQEGIHRGGSSPWGMAALVVFLLVLVSFHSSFESQWFRPLWR
ncbi:hypothetical protein IEQ34_013973 [Dendrobium chrysotoxum]|uniref:Uncharacterized protein n=1 Tax=Dendrobium chrysotoxum TaxID=161865 RepID=A0AAV7GIW5_DENCH|nr:hypothetical protein IEQ34_013973 [Dendrobium chrysotoxum]